MFIYEAAAVPAANSLFNLLMFLPLALVFYFLILRPQQNKVKEHKRMIDSIRRGDIVVISGGIIGEVSKVDEAHAQFIIEIGSKVEVKVLKSAISEVLSQNNKKNKDKSIQKKGGDMHKRDEDKDESKDAQ